MPAPVLLSELKALLPSPTANLCDAFTKALIAFPTKIYQLFTYIFDDQGNVRSEFLQATGVIEWDASVSVDEHVGTSGVKGRLLCNGQAVLRTTYATLFAKIGTTYGAGDGTNTFNVPDLQARTMVGVGTGEDAQEDADGDPTPESRTIALGESDGEFRHAIRRVELPSDMFGANVDDVFVALSAAGTFTVNTTPGGTHALRDWQGTSTPHNTMQPFLGLRAYIKT